MNPALEGIYRVFLTGYDDHWRVVRHGINPITDTNVEEALTMLAIDKSYGMNPKTRMGRLNLSYSILFYHFRSVRGLSHFDAKAEVHAHPDKLEAFGDRFLGRQWPQMFDINVADVDFWLRANWLEGDQAIQRPGWLDEGVPEGSVAGSQSSLLDSKKQIENAAEKWTDVQAGTVRVVRCVRCGRDFKYHEPPVPDPKGWFPFVRKTIPVCPFCGESAP